MTDKTIDYYNENADNFYAQTVTVDMTPLYERFLAYVPSRGHILDAGCGSGRDSKCFLDGGYRVTAFDASDALARKASELLGQPVECRRFTEINYKEEFDAIWACASLLHVHQDDLSSTLEKLASHLKDGGVLYSSFKCGLGERSDENGRHFTDMTMGRLQRLIKETPELRVVDVWKTVDQRPSRKDESWLNIIATKSAANSQITLHRS